MNWRLSFTIFLVLGIVGCWGAALYFWFVSSVAVAGIGNVLAFAGTSYAVIIYYAHRHGKGLK